MKQYILFAMLSAASSLAMDYKNIKENDTRINVKKNNAFMKSDSDKIEEYLQLGIGLSNNNILIYREEDTNVIIYSPHGRQGNSWKCAKKNEDYQAYYKSSPKIRKFSNSVSLQIYALLLNHYKSKIDLSEFQQQLAQYLSS